MNLKLAAKCTAVEKGDGAFDGLKSGFDEVELQCRSTDLDDVPGSFHAESSIRLTLNKPELRGQFEPGTEYDLDITIAPRPQPSEQPAALS